MTGAAPGPVSVHSVGRGGRTLAALAAFFLSGLAGLAYELAWIQLGALAFGSTTVAASSVLAAYFAGIAIGSAVGGRLAVRASRPLRVYAALEIGAALLAIAGLLGLPAADALYGAFHRMESGAPGPLLHVVRASLIAVIVLPPCGLLGASLPLVVRHFVRRDARVGAGVGALYALNTSGAAAGAWLTGLYVIPQVGARGALVGGAALSVVAGLLALVADLDRRDVARAGTTDDPASPNGASPLPSIAYVCLCAGLVSLGGQLVWIRFLGLLVRRDVESVTLSLFVVLVGIVLGSAGAALVLDRTRAGRGFLGTLLAGCAVLLPATLALPVAWWRVLQDSHALLAIVLLPAAILSGASLPTAVRIASRGAGQAPVATGRLVAWNTTGAILGALAVGFVGLPGVGIEGSVVVLSLVALSAAFVSWLGAERGGAGGAAIRLAVAMALCLAVPIASGTRVPAAHLVDEGEQLVDFREGWGANVALVRHHGVTDLEIDRWWQGGSHRGHQPIAAHVPAILHADPRHVLVVGVGAGQTPAAFLDHGVERLDVVEIEPVVFDLMREHLDAAWLDDARTRVHVVDGRQHVLHAEGRHDVISLELGQVFRPGIAPFYSVDFYRAARARLAPGGLLVQFVPLPFLPPDVLRRVVASFVAVFPASVLWYNASELLLIGFERDVVGIDPRRYVETARREGVAADLAWSHWGGERFRLDRAESFYGGFLLGPTGLAALADGAPPYRDDPPSLAHEVADVRAEDFAETGSIALVRRFAEPIDPYWVDLADDPTADPAIDVALVHAVQGRNLDALDADRLLREGAHLGAIGDAAGRARAFEGALSALPDHVDAMLAVAELDLASDRPVDAERLSREAVTARPDSVRARHLLALALHRLGRSTEAGPHYRAAIAATPEDAELRNNYGISLATLGRARAALREFETARELDPASIEIQRNLTRARALVGSEVQSP